MRMDLGQEQGQGLRHGKWQMSHLFSELGRDTGGTCQGRTQNSIPLHYAQMNGPLILIAA